ncbi:hypothetical protein GYMLUDRAFT_258717 [Collybiopsis luxurians FD-317 M1]|nr:hypothetical protein GYMLUDRAFT_258717 [Collybiopsis luxurians FD-317 M1]
MSSVSNTTCASPTIPSVLFGVSLDDTLGAAFIGYSFSCAVLGILTCQVFNYYQRYAADSLGLKTLVATIWSLETLHVILISHALYHYTVSLFGLYLPIITEPIVWSLTWIIILVQFGWIIAYAAGAYQLESILNLSKLMIQGSVALALGALAEVFIALALIFYLRKMRTGYKEPDSLVESLTTYAIHSGALTSTLSLLTLILYDARPNTFDFMGAYFVLSKTFAVSFMCTLNTRKLIAGQVVDEQSVSVNSHTDIPFSIPGPNTFQMEETPVRVKNGIQPYLIRESQFSTSKQDMKLMVTSV